MRKFIILLLISAMSLGILSSCAWMGRVAGKTVATGENIADSISDTADEKSDSMKDGYDQGYEQKRKK